MTFDESLEWLYSTQFFGIKLGLDNTRRLLGHLGNPEKRLRILHVAGTNGKGSTCAMMDSIFRAAGLRSGLYTSPHLCDFRERVRVNGEWISVESARKTLARLHDLCRDWPHPPTFFELTTVLALDHFVREKCDVVILETGMGGRLDATNAVTPVVSVLTPVAMDHAEWLGDSIGKIAVEKAGIIKPGVPVVSAPQTPEAAEVFRSRARECGSELMFVESFYEGEVGLKGPHQKENAVLALAAVKAAGFALDEKSLLLGLRDVVWPARFQQIGDRIVVDGAHNPHAALTLVETWREEFGDRKAVVVFGALKDKDYTAMLAILAGIADSFFLVPVDSPRSAEPGELKAPGASKNYTSLRSALEGALAGTAPILITGSLFLAGEALGLLKDLRRES